MSESLLKRAKPLKRAEGYTASRRASVPGRDRFAREEG